MKVKILKTYTDTLLKRMIKRGSVIDVNDDRAALLEGMGYAQILKAEASEEVNTDIAPSIVDEELEIKIPEEKETKIVKKRSKKNK